MASADSVRPPADVGDSKSPADLHNGDLSASASAASSRASADSGPPLPPFPYVRTREVRAGNLGALWRGHRAGDEKQLVALKYSRLGSTSLESPRTEVKVLARLNKDKHPHIIRMLDTSDDNKFVCLVMEWADGGGLVGGVAGS